MRWLDILAAQPLMLLALLAAVAHAQADNAAEPLVSEAIPKWEKKLLKQFESSLYALFQDGESGCIDCHSSEGTSALVLSGNPLDDLRLLLDNRYLADTGPDSLLGRVASDNPERRMPKAAEAWPDEQVKQLRRLVNSVERLQQQTGVKADERFPRSLLQPLQTAETPTPSNQFISYRQLVGKTEVIFGDDWMRGDRDMFAENVAMFGGTDFKTRFNEATEPSATFLTGLEMLARDVATRAYQRRSGPFANWREPHTDALDLRTADGQHRQAVQHLFQAILYRSPTAAEVTQAMELLRGVRELEGEIAQRAASLVFELTLTDPETGRTASRTIEIPVSGDSLEVRQVVIDQRAGERRTAGQVQPPKDPLDDQVETEIAAASDAQKLGSAPLGNPVILRPHEPNQRVVIYNDSTHRNVSFAGIEVRDTQGKLVSAIAADASVVQLEGAWELMNKDGFISYEDGNRHKGLSSISIPLGVDTLGEYQIVLLWRPNEANTPHALVQLFAEGASNQLSPVETTLSPPPGIAHFTYDSSNDTAPFCELDGLFQFDTTSYVEISNAETLQLVTAGAIEFLPENENLRTVLVDSQDAAGSESWSQFDEGRFKAYNVKGKKLHDDNQRKGELSLVYRPHAQSLDEDESADDEKGCREGESYRIRVYYPGKRDQETRVPVKVVAHSSSPIVQVSHPVFAKADTHLRLDASASYTVQGSQLHYCWKQISGPPVELTEPESAVIEFNVPRLSSRQFAWAGLCAALMRHPDFLFTRPPSLSTASEPDKQRLQLVKLAQDLVGRPPTPEELNQLAAGKSYEAMVEHFLDSQEFRDFYFHRIRLYLESQGTDVQDEPARLWSFIAFEDRPFQEILTADYSVDEHFQRRQRPDFHGKTGVLTSAGFIQGKPGLPHYNYAAQVSMLFLGYVYEVPPEIVEQREGVTALGTTDPNSSCYSCHKILTPLAFQRLNWTDEGKFRTRDEDDLEIDASDRGVVDEYPFRGEGLEAFATQAVKKERFIRTIINTHVNFYLGRPLRYRQEDRGLYKQLWDNVHENDFKIRELIGAIVTSDQYLVR